jgi:hypothetical protein
MLASATGLSWSSKFGIVQGIAYQSAAPADRQMTLQVGQGAGVRYCSWRCDKAGRRFRNVDWLLVVGKVPFS